MGQKVSVKSFITPVSISLFTHCGTTNSGTTSSATMFWN